MIDLDTLRAILIRRRPDLVAPEHEGLIADLGAAVADYNEWSDAMQQLAYAETLDRLSQSVDPAFP